MLVHWHDPRFTAFHSQVDKPLPGWLLPEPPTRWGLDRPRVQWHACVDRLFRVEVLRSPRWLLDPPSCADATADGVATGLSDTKLVRALKAMHEQAAADAALAVRGEGSGMPRSAFAVGFKRQAGRTPAESLTQWLTAVAQFLLRNGAAIKTERTQSGCQNVLSRAFTLAVGASPRAWLHAQG